MPVIAYLTADQEEIVDKRGVQVDHALFIRFKYQTTKGPF
jgi:hypothetical protein